MKEIEDLGGLACKLDLPVSWVVDEAASSIAPTHHFNNQNRLHMILGLDEVSHEASDDVQELGHEIHRLDFKLNVILELVGQLVSQNLELPQVYAVTLGPQALQISSAEAPPEGAQLSMKIYLDQRFPFSLDIAVEVVSVEKLSSGYVSRFNYLDMGDVSLELLEKYIFRQHRRQIAQMRRSVPK